MAQATSKDRPIRLSMLAGVAAIALISLGKALLYKTPHTPGITYNFPATVPLPGWQLINAEPLSWKSPSAPSTTSQEAAPQASEIAVAQTYIFAPVGVQPADATRASSSAPLQANTYYIAPATEGNVNRYVFVYSPLKAANANLQERQRADIGSYGVLAHEGRAYLTACTSNHGPSTFTEQQFTRNRSRRDLTVGTIMLWLAGQRDLLDHRCLWTLLSVPIAGGANASPENVEQAYQQLETIWVPWHRWWQQNFPPLPKPQ
jgi:cyanosortase A-associated protein